jgi:hypothetical protein
MIQAENPKQFLRSEYRHADLREILQLTPGVLAGTDQIQVDSLQSLDIHSVFDLATSRVFGNASAIDQAADDNNHLFRRSNSLTADVLSPDAVQDIPVEELRYQGIGLLSGIGVRSESTLQQALHVVTIQDLANYPPYQFAKAILNAVFFPETRMDFDSEAPSDLLPKSGEYPTEKVSYTTLVFDGVGQQTQDQTLDILSEAFAPLDVFDATATSWGFDKVAFGALLTFSQSWYMEGVTLGQLLHSTALAPGESTRIAVIDWSRRSRAGQTEYIDESDDLSNDTSHKRSISEVTSAVANEAQGGFSGTSTTSKSKQSAKASASTTSGDSLGGAVTDLVSGGLKAASQVIDSILPF